MTDSNLVNVITADHRAVESAFGELEAGMSTPQRRRELVDHVIAELVRHSVAEEQYMYPVVRDHVPDGPAIADHEIAEHAEAEQVMKELDGMAVDDPRFEPRLRELIDEIRHHVEEEEGTLLPRLAAVCPPEDLEELGEKVLRAKKIAPTRPHPSAPDRPPANLILDPGVGLVDRIRDKLTGRDV